jgi:hypothetical protein
MTSGRDGFEELGSADAMEYTPSNNSSAKFSSPKMPRDENRAYNSNQPY